MGKIKYLVLSILYLVLLGTFVAHANAQTNPQTFEIHMTKYGFSPQKLVVTQGSVVTFINDDVAPHWPASDPHPAHTLYPELDPKREIEPNGDKWDFSAQKIGTWGFHDHLDPTKKGTLVVDQSSFRTPLPKAQTTQGSAVQNGSIFGKILAAISNFFSKLFGIKDN